MAIQPSIAGPGALLGHSIRVAPSLAVLVLLTAVVLAVVYAYQPPLPQTMVFAFLPWVVTGSFLAVMTVSGAYPAYLLPVFTYPGVYLLAVFLPGLVWMVLLNVSVSRRGLPAYHHYIGTMGVGAMTVLWAVLTFHDGTGRLEWMLLLLVVPLTALLAAGLVSITIGLWSPDFVEYTAITGGFVLFGSLVYGIATTTHVAVDGVSAHTVVSAAVLDVARTIAATLLANTGVVVDPTHVWAWLFLASATVGGILVATQLSRFAADRPRTVHVIHGFVGIVAFTIGFNHLLLLAVTGP